MIRSKNVDTWEQIARIEHEARSEDRETNVEGGGGPAKWNEGENRGKTRYLYSVERSLM